MVARADAFPLDRGLGLGGIGSGSGREWGLGKCKLLNSHTLHVCVCKFVFSVRHFREHQLLSTILANSKDDLRKEAILM